MSDIEEEELISTKLNNGTMTTNQLLDYWFIKYNIPKWQIDHVRSKLKREKRIWRI